MPSPEDRVVIASSKVKLILLTAGAFLFVVAGIWMFDVADTQRRYAPMYVRVMSVLAIGFFGLSGLYGLRKLFDGSPGLVLDREGIIVYASGIAAGRVAWREIRDIQVVSVSGQQFLAITVEDPEKFLMKGNVLGRWFARMNHKAYGTPIFISSHSLTMKFEDLEERIQDFHKRHRNT